MKKSTPKPFGARILIEPKELNTGAFKVTLPTAQEVATVISIGEGWNHIDEPLKVGDKIHVKSWAIDLISDGDDKYYYVWQETGGICAVIK